MPSTPLGIMAFGTALIKSRDLDPVYCSIVGAGLDNATKARLVLAYSCLYHLGAAARIAELKGGKFWDALQEAAVNTGLKWPRGSERRHWRGDNAVKSAACLRNSFKKPEDAIAYWSRGNVPGYSDYATFSEVSSRVQQSAGFGPWIAFKIADITERVMGYQVDFSDCALGIYKDPRQGAAVAYQEMRGEIYSVGSHTPWTYPITDAELRQTCDHYVKAFSKLKAPPTGDRKCGIQEVETVFCKYKSHLKGHYPLGKDSKEVHHALTGWGDLAMTLQCHVPSWDDKFLPK